MARNAGILLVSAVLLWMGHEAVGRPKQLADSELACRIAGQDCAQATIVGNSNCTGCVQVVDKWERCNQAQAITACAAYNGPGEPHCTAVMANCGGNLLSYTDPQKCNQNQNPTDLGPCVRQYQGTVTWHNPDADCFPP